MARLKIRRGDRVVVLSGRDKGKSGEVLKMIPDESRVVVRGINMARHHQKQTAQQEGGIISREAPIHISNLAVEDPKDGKPTRVGFRFEEGVKVRFAKRSGEIIPEAKLKND
ncbi:MAG: 50S ribosomal protein L24 [Pseudomonadota bacterium]